MQALTRHPFTQKLNKYCIIQLQKIGLPFINQPSALLLLFIRKYNAIIDDFAKR